MSCAGRSFRRASSRWADSHSVDSWLVALAYIPPLPCEFDRSTYHRALVLGWFACNHCPMRWGGVRSVVFLWVGLACVPPLSWELGWFAFCHFQVSWAGLHSAALRRRHRLVYAPSPTCELCWSASRRVRMSWAGLRSVAPLRNQLVYVPSLNCVLGSYASHRVPVSWAGLSPVAPG